MARLFIGNLPFDTQEEELRQALGVYGVSGIHMPKDRETGRFRGFAFAEVTEYEKAIKELNGGDFGGRPLKINIAQERPTRPEPRPHKSQGRT